MKKSDNKWTSANLLDRFDTNLMETERSETTRKGYLSDLRDFTLWFKGRGQTPVSLNQISDESITDYSRFLQNERKLKASTINRHLVAISVFSNWVRCSGVAPEMGIPKIHYLEHESVPPRWLEDREQSRLQDVIENDLRLAEIRFHKRKVTRRRDACLASFILHTGLRLNETIQLRLEDLDLSKRQGKLWVNRNKGNERVILLNAKARQDLETWLEVRPSTKNNFLWVAVENGQPAQLSSRTIQRILHRFGEEAGLPDLTPQALRHTYARNLVKAHASPKTIAASLGYKRVDIVQIYFQPVNKR